MKCPHCESTNIKKNAYTAMGNKIGVFGSYCELQIRNRLKSELQIPTSISSSEFVTAVELFGSKL